MSSKPAGVVHDPLAGGLADRLAGWLAGWQAGRLAGTREGRGRFKAYEGVLVGGSEANS